MNKLNVAVVGYGLAGRCFHAYLVGLVPDLKLRAVVSSRPEAREAIERDLGALASAALVEKVSTTQPYRGP